MVLKVISIRTMKGLITNDSYLQNITKMDVISMPERSSREVKEPEDIAETLTSSYDE